MQPLRQCFLLGWLDFKTGHLPVQWVVDPPGRPQAKGLVWHAAAAAALSLTVLMPLFAPTRNFEWFACSIIALIVLPIWSLIRFGARGLITLLLALPGLALPAFFLFLMWRGGFRHW
jgi:hypothetical protein